MTNSKGNNATRSVSMTPELLAAAEARAAGTGLPNFSAYVRKLIQDDLAERASLVFTEAPLSKRPKRVA